MFFIPLPRRAYFGARNDAVGRVESADRNRKLNRTHAAQRKFYNALRELESLDENGLTEAGLQQLKIRLNDLNLQTGALIDDVEQVIRDLRDKEAGPGVLLEVTPRDQAAANIRAALGVPTPRDLAKGGRR